MKAVTLAQKKLLFFYDHVSNLSVADWIIFDISSSYLCLSAFLRDDRKEYLKPFNSLQTIAIFGLGSLGAFV